MTGIVNLTHEQLVDVVVDQCAAVDLATKACALLLTIPTSGNYRSAAIMAAMHLRKALLHVERIAQPPRPE